MLERETCELMETGLESSCIQPAFNFQPKCQRAPSSRQSGPPRGLIQYRVTQTFSRLSHSKLILAVAPSR